MADSVSGRRTRENKTRKTVEASRASGVSRERLGEILGSKYGSIEDLQAAIDDAMKGGGSDAPKMDDTAGRGGGILSRLRRLKKKVKG